MVTDTTPFDIVCFCFFFRYRPWPDDMVALDIAYMIYMKFKAYPNALQIALLLDNMQVWVVIFIKNLISSK